MATVQPTVRAMQVGVMEIVWDGLNTGDDGEWVAGLSRYPIKTVDVSGTTVTDVSLQGRDQSQVARTLNDSRGQGNSLQFAAPGFREVLENADAIRPLVTTGAAVRVRLVAAR
jgi:hypothetical protein